MPADVHRHPERQVPDRPTHAPAVRALASAPLPLNLALRRLGQGRWADERELNPVDSRTLLALFPPGIPVRLVRQRVAGLTTVLIAVADREPQAHPDLTEQRAPRPGQLARARR